MDQALINVEPLAVRDLPAAAALVADLPFYREYGYDAGRVSGWLHDGLATPGDTLLAANLAGTLSGLAWLQPRGAFGRSPYLRLLAVAAGAQGRGVGRRLLGVLEEQHLRPHGLLLLCSAANAPAQRFYERLGYTLVGSLPGYVRPDVAERLYYKRS